MKERYHKEYEQFLALATAAGIKPDSNGSLPAARSFGEELILCPSEARAVALVKADKAAASTFLELAMHYDDQLGKGVIKIANEPPEGSLPFFVLAGAVLEFLDGLREQYPQGFE